MKKLFAYVLTPLYFLVWGGLLGFFHVAQIIALRGFGPRAHRLTVHLLNGSLLHCLWLLGTRVGVRRKQVPPTDRPIIFVSNHQNQQDIPGLGWYLRKNAPIFVSKIELGKGIPSISYNLRHSGAALIDRSDARQALKEIARLGKLIEAQHSSAVIFPEGTRSRDGALKPFAAAGVKILLKNAPSALVVPVCIRGAWKLNRYGKFPMSVFERVSWTVLPAIDPQGKTPDAVAALAEAAIRDELQTQPEPRLGYVYPQIMGVCLPMLRKTTALFFHGR